MASYRWLFWLLAATGLILDQTSKYGVFAYLYNDGNGGRITVFEECFTIEAAYDSASWEETEGILHKLQTISGEVKPRVNKGALFGLGHGFNGLFAVVSLVAAAAIIIFSHRPSIRRDGLLCFALGLIMAGCLGNFYDRLVFDGVRDFIHWYIGEAVKGGQVKILYDWPVFNIADCCLVVGASTLVIHAFFFPDTATSPTETKTQESAVVPS